MSRISVFSEPLRLGNQRPLRINRHVKFTSPRHYRNAVQNIANKSNG